MNLYHSLDAEGSSQMILPTQNLEKSYYLDKESAIRTYAIDLSGVVDRVANSLSDGFVNIKNVRKAFCCY